MYYLLHDGVLFVTFNVFKYSFYDFTSKFTIFLPKNIGQNVTSEQKTPYVHVHKVHKTAIFALKKNKQTLKNRG